MQFLITSRRGGKTTKIFESAFAASRSYRALVVTFSDRRAMELTHEFTYWISTQFPETLPHNPQVEFIAFERLIEFRKPRRNGPEVVLIDDLDAILEQIFSPRFSDQYRSPGIVLVAATGCLADVPRSPHLSESALDALRAGLNVEDEKFKRYLKGDWSADIGPPPGKGRT